jgi:hypothetical protein
MDELYERFEQLNGIKLYVLLLACAQNVANANLAPLGIIFSCTSKLINGYITKHAHLPIFTDDNNITAFRGWLDTKVLKLASNSAETNAEDSINGEEFSLTQSFSAIESDNDVESVSANVMIYIMMIKIICDRKTHNLFIIVVDSDNGDDKRSNVELTNAFFCTSGPILIRMKL